MLSIVLASAAAVGVYLLLPETATGRDHAATSGRDPVRSIPGRWRRFAEEQLVTAGLAEVPPQRFLAISLATGATAGALVAALAGPGLAMFVVGACVTAVPGALWRRRALHSREAVADAWPRLIEEIRVRVGSLGHSIPQALLECESSAPESLRPGFAAARREWMLGTDFASTVATLKDHCADPTADAVCETLLVVHEVGGDVDRRLEDLAEDRRAARRDRKEATARLAGARVARWFVILVPAGMAFAGMSLGNGSDAYRSGTGQVAAAFAVVLIAACWWWAGLIMRTPREQRVFDR